VLRAAALPPLRMAGPPSQAGFLFH